MGSHWLSHLTTSNCWTPISLFLMRAPIQWLRSSWRLQVLQLGAPHFRCCKEASFSKGGDSALPSCQSRHYLVPDSEEEGTKHQTVYKIIIFIFYLFHLSLWRFTKKQLQDCRYSFMLAFPPLPEERDAEFLFWLQLPTTRCRIPKPSFAVTAPMLALHMRPPQHTSHNYIILCATTVPNLSIPKSSNLHHYYTGVSADHKLPYAWHSLGGCPDDAQQGVHSVFSPRVAMLGKHKSSCMWKRYGKKA